MFIFFFVNLVFLLLLLIMDKRFFWLGSGINLLIYLTGILCKDFIVEWLGSRFAFWMLLTGLSFIVILILFFVVAFDNHKHLDNHLKNKNAP